MNQQQYELCQVFALHIVSKPSKRKISIAIRHRGNNKDAKEIDCTSLSPSLSEIVRKEFSWEQSSNEILLNARTIEVLWLSMRYFPNSSLRT